MITEKDTKNNKATEKNAVHFIIHIFVVLLLIIVIMILIYFNPSIITSPFYQW
jgi:hypothetical protein